MKKILIVCVLFICVIFTACDSPEVNEVEPIKNAHFTYEFADVQKGKELLLSNTEYHNNMTKTDLEYRRGCKNSHHYAGGVNFSNPRWMGHSGEF